MISKILNWLSAPTIEDKYTNLRARMLSSILNAITAAVIYGLIINFLAGRRQPVVYMMWFISLALALGMRNFLRRGLINLVSYSVVIISGLVVTCFAIIWGTIRSPNTAFYILIVVLAGLLINRRAMIFTVFICSLIVLALVLAENAGWLPPADTSTALPLWTSYIIMFSVTALLLNFVLENIDEAFNRSRQEVAERKRIEAFLRESEVKFRSIFEHSTDGVMLTDNDGAIIEWNQAIETITGYKRAEVLGEFAWDMQFQMMPDESKSRIFPEIIRTRITKALATGNGEWLNKSNEGRLIRADGKHIYFQQISFLVPMENQIHLASITRDITTRKLVETALKLNESRLNSLLELSEKSDQMTEAEIIEYGLEQAVSITDSQIGYFHFVNEDQETIELFTWSEGALQGCQAVFDPHYPLSAAGVWADCARTKRPVVHNDYANLDVKGGLPEGHSPLIRHTSIPVVDGDLVRIILGVGNKASEYDDADVRQLSLMADAIWKIVQRKRSESELRLLNENLEMRVIERTNQLDLAYRELEMISYNVSHTLRAPLRAIDGYSRLALEETRDLELPKATIYFNNLRQSAQEMGLIIDDLLNLLRVTRTQTDPTAVNLSEIIENLLATLQQAEPDRDLRAVIAPEITVYADAKLIELALEQLLDNAWKFTRPMAQARIEFGVQEGEDGPIYFIRDNGVGFNMDYANKIFDAFERLHLVDDFEGSGIGLAIAQRIIKLHAGSIWVEAVKGGGATFYITLGTLQE
ncbi:GAF domain-containing protein [Chloroflexota bacterium]